MVHLWFWASHLVFGLRRVEVKSLWSHFISEGLQRGFRCVKKPLHLIYISSQLVQERLNSFTSNGMNQCMKKTGFKTLYRAGFRDLCVCVCGTAGCNVAFSSLCLSLLQSMPTGCATGWPRFAPRWSLRPRGSLKMPGRFPGSPCDWSSSWARAASERSGWVRARQTTRTGTCSQNALWRHRFVYYSLVMI